MGLAYKYVAEYMPEHDGGDSEGTRCLFVLGKPDPKAR
jgi:hypothetical protein